MEPCVKIHPNIETKFHFGYTHNIPSETGHSILYLENKDKLTKLENYEKVYLQNSLRLYYLYRRYYPFYIKHIQKIKEKEEVKKFANLYYFLLFLTNPKILKGLEADIMIMPTVFKSIGDVIGVCNPPKQEELNNHLKKIYIQNTEKFEKIVKEIDANPSSIKMIFAESGLGTDAIYGKITCAKGVPAKIKVRLFKTLSSQNVLPNAQDLEFFLKLLQIENYTFVRILSSYDIHPPTFEKYVRTPCLAQKKELLQGIRPFLQSVSQAKLLYPNLFYARIIEWLQIETEMEYQTLFPEYPYTDLIRSLEEFDKNVLYMERYNLPIVPKILKKYKA